MRYNLQDGRTIMLWSYVYTSNATEEIRVSSETYIQRLDDELRISLCPSPRDVPLRRDSASDSSRSSSELC
jgi:hypothetical protein